MNNFFIKEAQNIANKLSTIRKKLNISVNQLESALFISKGTIANVENGDVVKLETAVGIGYFFGMTLKELADENLLVPLEPELRKKIKEFHAANGIKDTERLLDLQPTIKTVLIDRVLPSGVLDTPASVDDILVFCEQNYKLNYIKPSVERILKELIEEDVIHYLEAKGLFMIASK